MVRWPTQDPARMGYTSRQPKLSRRSCTVSEGMDMNRFIRALACAAALALLSGCVIREGYDGYDGGRYADNYGYDGANARNYGYDGYDTYGGYGGYGYPNYDYYAT